MFVGRGRKIRKNQIMVLEFTNFSSKFTNWKLLRIIVYQNSVKNSGGKALFKKKMSKSGNSSTSLSLYVSQVVAFFWLG